MSTVAIDGECFIVHLKGKQYGKFGYQIQLIDASQVDEKLNEILPNGNYIQMGIEFNKNRKPINYHFKKSDPSQENTYGMYYENKYDIISADKVTHLFVKEFINQARGICWFAPVALRMHMLNKTSEAAVINFRVGASKTLVLEPTENTDPNLTEADAVDPYGRALDNVEPGETYKIPYGYKPFDYNPQYPNAEFGIFTEAIMQQIASGLDTTHPSLSSSYRGTTWTSSRTALIDERDGWKRIQNWFAEHCLDDIFPNWLYMALLTNAVAPLPAEKFEKFNEAFWYGRGFSWVDPEKEENARIKQLKYNFKTFGEIIADDNKDLEEHLEELAAEKELFVKYNINFPDDIPVNDPEDDAEDKSPGENENSTDPEKKNGKALNYEKIIN